MTLPIPRDVLKWYVDHGVNHGRGRTSGELRRLIDAGAVRFQRTGHYTWTATITERGRALLRELGGW